MNFIHDFSKDEVGRGTKFEGMPRYLILVDEILKLRKSLTTTLIEEVKELLLK